MFVFEFVGYGLNVVVMVFDVCVDGVYVGVVWEYCYFGVLIGFMGNCFDFYDVVGDFGNFLFE